MRVSFDIDGLLTSPEKMFLGERRRVPFYFGFPEILRRRTGELFSAIKKLGADVWIYTTSTRSKFYIRVWLLLHGIKVSGIVNADVHSKVISSMRFERAPSKYPPAFGIDLHVDDSSGVREEGIAHGFKVVIIDPLDELWVEMILSEIFTCKSSEA